MVSLDPVAEKEKHPPTQKKSRSQDPFCEEQKDNPGKNHRDANAMEEFVPAGFVLVIVLRHVVRQARHLAHLLSAMVRLPKGLVGDSHRSNKLYTELDRMARAS